MKRATFKGLMAVTRKVLRGGVFRRGERTVGPYTPAVPCSAGYRYAIVSKTGDVLGRYFDPFEAADDLIHDRARDQTTAEQEERWRLEDAAPEIERRVDEHREWVAMMRLRRRGR